MFAFNFLISVKREMKVTEMEETLQFYLQRNSAVSLPFDKRCFSAKKQKCFMTESFANFSQTL